MDSSSNEVLLSERACSVAHVSIVLCVFMLTALCICVYILSAISPYTTGLKVLFNPSDRHRYSHNSEVTDTSITGGQRLKDDCLSKSLRFFSVILEIGPNDRGRHFK